MLPVTHAAAIAIHSILILSMPLHPPVSRSVDRLDLRSRIQLVPQSFHSNGQGVLVHVFRAVCPEPVDQTWLPSEFHLIDKQAIDGNTLMIYADDSGQRITFSYSQGDNATSLFIASDYTEVKSVQIGNIKADFYQAGQEASANVLVWLSEEDTFCFCIMADLSEDTMIKLAENVQKNN